jgi:hypothetical protein
MKTLTALLLTLGVVLVAAAQTPPRAKTPPAPAPAGNAAPTKDGAKKEEPPAKIEGMEIARGAKGFLGLQVVDGKFKLSFYDAKKKPIAPDVTRAALRWDPKGTTGTERTLLTAAGDGKSLTSGKVIRPPYLFRIFMALQKDDPAAESENLVVDFRQ